MCDSMYISFIQLFDICWRPASGLFLFLQWLVYVQLFLAVRGGGDFSLLMLLAGHSRFPFVQCSLAGFSVGLFGSVASV